MDEQPRSPLFQRLRKCCSRLLGQYSVTALNGSLGECTSRNKFSQLNEITFENIGRKVGGLTSTQIDNSEIKHCTAVKD